MNEVHQNNLLKDEEYSKLLQEHLSMKQKLVESVDRIATLQDKLFQLETNIVNLKSDLDKKTQVKNSF